ncbi:Cas4-domain exonuclease [Stenotrophomonas phage Siara]|uniref:RecB-like exonuclease n=1 Tax=Stenotrophomonas phage Siara TaxID=2859658 RepID=A0AAE8BJF8_9CAUD|nr:Cas4-domain exonuclease [Stenotrophomonas phage Siara]QYW02066.1 RecB-like exonuclease [Stenotrophomonas phage Siara]
MPIYIAKKTIKAIADKMYADQGASFRQWSGKIMPHMDDAWRGEEEPFRSHMGASLIGRECAREVWLSWHWAAKKMFDGRMLRLFNRGHMEEARFLAMLSMIGVKVANQDANGKQYRISGAGGHFGGSGDGMAYGLPDVKLGTIALLEFKTHSLKPFTKIAGSGWAQYVEDIVAGREGHFNGVGVKEGKPEHYVQMQCYMRKMGYGVCLYAAVHKDTDNVYMEMVPLDTAKADLYLDLADRLVANEMPPKRIGNSPGFFKCRFCDMRMVCHKLEAPVKNCRTCEFAVPIMGNGEWGCKKDGTIIPKAKQFIGCTEYVVNPRITE